MVKILDALSDKINRIVQFVLGAMAIIMLVVNLAQIAGRYVFFHSIPWSEELSTYMYVWIIFLSLHMLSKERSELSIDAIRCKNPRNAKIILILRESISLLAVAVLLVASIMIVSKSMQFPQKTASLKLNTSVMYLCMPISFFLVTLQKLTNIIKAVRGGPEAGNEEAGT